MLAHVAAFNAHDSERMLSGFAPAAVWSTGTDTFRTVAALATLFDQALWALRPTLTVRSMVVNGSTVAAELRESLFVDGELRTYDIAVFFTVQAGLIVQARVYREGSADID